MNNVKDSLERIIKWVTEKSPQTISHLNPPATDKEIEEVELKTGLQLPDAFKEILKTFNGEDGQSWLALFGDGNQMLSCKNIIEQFELDIKIGESVYSPDMETFEFWQDRVTNNIIFVKGTVKPLMRHQKWLPFTCMNGDVFRFIDFDPATGGKRGQVIEVDPESCSYQVLADSFEVFLKNYADQLENAEYIVNEDVYIESKTQTNQMEWGIPDWLK